MDRRGQKKLEMTLDGLRQDTNFQEPHQLMQFVTKQQIGSKIQDSCRRNGGIGETESHGVWNRDLELAFRPQM